MHVIFARNVNDAYVAGMEHMAQFGERTPSRNGDVLRVPYPVTTVYAKPDERVLFDPQRDCNPFFHLFEALWMLNGQNDVASLRQFVKTFDQFSDDGISLHGAYGHRWRHWPNPENRVASDQLEYVIRALKANPNDRRIIIGMWDPHRDLGQAHNDIPCNTTIKVGIVKGRLSMIVFCRSNDIVWGCYGANAVHMSFLQEYLAQMIGVPLGTYSQISVDYHAYTDTPYKWDRYFPLTEDARDYDDGITTFPLVHHPPTFEAELWRVMSFVTDQSLHTKKLCGYQNLFFLYVALPMYMAHRFYRNGDKTKAIELLQDARIHKPGMATREFHAGNDWLTAGIEWLVRRLTPKP